jgi:6-phosphogluconolactonase (cycloisomerase 2 family)
MGDGGLDSFAPGSPLTIAHFFLTSHDRCFTPSSLAVHPSGKFLYLDCPGDDISTTITAGSGSGRATNAGRAFAIQAYQVEPSSGTFTLLETLDCCETQAVLNGVLIQPQGSFLLALTEGVSVFSIDQSSGTLTQVPGSPFAVTSGDFSAQLFPRTGTLDKTGTFVYVVRGSDLTVAAFSLNASTGALTQLPGTTISLGSGNSQFSMQVAQP